LWWYADETFFFRGKDKSYLHRAVDEHGQVVDVLLRHLHPLKHSSSRRRPFRSGAERDHHRPPSTIRQALQRSVPTAVHIRSGLHRATGETTKPIERGHVPTRDRLCVSRGLKTLRTGQRFLEGFERLRALRGGHMRLADLLPAFSASASPHDHVRTVAGAVLVLGTRLSRNPRTRRR